eukprot:COSAG01_NODE_16246_length_1255_cov_1.520761_3_plen_118_part_01
MAKRNKREVGAAAILTAPPTTYNSIERNNMRTKVHPQPPGDHEQGKVHGSAAKQQLLLSGQGAVEYGAVVVIWRDLVSRGRWPQSQPGPYYIHVIGTQGVALDNILFSDYCHRLVLHA